MSHVELDQAEISTLAGVLAVRPLVLQEECAPFELGVWLSGLGPSAVPGKTAHHAPGRHVVLRVFELVVIDARLEPEQSGRKAQSGPQVQAIRNILIVELLQEVRRKICLLQLVIWILLCLLNQLLYIGVVPIVTERLNNVGVVATRKQGKFDGRDILKGNLRDQPVECSIHQHPNCELLRIGHSFPCYRVVLKRCYLLKKLAHLVQQGHAVHSNVQIQLVPPNNGSHLVLEAFGGQ